MSLSTATAGYLAIYDASCNPIFSSARATGRVAFAPSGHLWIASNVSPVIELTEMELTGAVVSTHTFTPSQGGVATADAFLVDRYGDLVIAGAIKGSVDFGGGALTAVGSRNAFVTKLAPNGAHRWSKRFGAATAAVKAIALTATGDIAVVGTYQDTFDLGGPALPVVPVLKSAMFLGALSSASGSHQWSGGWVDVSPAGIGTAADTTIVTAGIKNADLGTGVITSGGVAAGFRSAATASWTRTDVGTPASFAVRGDYAVSAGVGPLGPNTVLTFDRHGKVAPITWVLGNPGRPVVAIGPRGQTVVAAAFETEAWYANSSTKLTSAGLGDIYLLQQPREVSLYVGNSTVWR